MKGESGVFHVEGIDTERPCGWKERGMLEKLKQGQEGMVRSAALRDSWGQNVRVEL